MDKYTLRVMNDAELTRTYDRALIDTVWLEKQLQSCDQKSPAYKHYESRLKKDVSELAILEDEMKTRKLFQ